MAEASARPSPPKTIEFSIKVTHEDGSVTTLDGTFPKPTLQCDREVIYPVDEYGRRKIFSDPIGETVGLQLTGRIDYPVDLSSPYMTVNHKKPEEQSK